MPVPLRQKMKGANMKIAIPVTDGKLCMHFGHCEEFALFKVDATNKSVLGKEVISAPPHQPGLLPGWLADRGADVVIAGGMGSRAQDLFSEKKIKVVVGACGENPEDIVKDYLNNSLQTGNNACDH